MAFDRSKYKAAPMAAVTSAQKAAKKSEKRLGNGSNRVPYFKVEEGKNKLRICPAHSPEDSPYQPIKSTMLNCEVDKYENGEKTGEKEVKLKKIFIASIHSPKDEEGNNLVTKDPVETYIQYVYDQAIDLYGEGSSGKSERDKYLKPIFGGYEGKKWVSGIRPNTQFGCYAFDSEKELVRASFYDSWMKKIQQISIDESEDDDVMSVDIFSHPDDGYPLIIKKEKSEKGKWEYTISAERQKKGEHWEDFIERVRLSDSQLKELEDQKSLKELLFGTYKESDFNLALDGLERFDKEHNYNIFANDDFLNEIGEISDQVDALPKKDEEKPKTEEKKEEKKKDTKPAKKATPLQKKKLIKAYIAENYEGKFMPALTDKELDEWYNLALNQDKLPFDPDEEMPFEVKDTDADLGTESDAARELRKKIEEMESED